MAVTVAVPGDVRTVVGAGTRGPSVVQGLGVGPARHPTTTAAETRTAARSVQYKTRTDAQVVEAAVTTPSVVPARVTL